MLSNNPEGSLAVQVRENDLQVAERLTDVIAKLANLGTTDQRTGRSRLGQFVAKPAAVEAQLPLEAALLSVAKRIKDREKAS